jgi:hypothetical protein
MADRHVFRSRCRSEGALWSHLVRRLLLNAAIRRAPQWDICTGIQSSGGRQAPAMNGTRLRMARTYPLRTLRCYPVQTGIFFKDFRPDSVSDFQAVAAAI